MNSILTREISPPLPGGKKYEPGVNLTLVRTVYFLLFTFLIERHSILFITNEKVIMFKFRDGNVPRNGK